MPRWIMLGAIVLSLLVVAWSGPSAAQAAGCQAFGAHIATDAAVAHPLGLAITEAGLPPLNDEALAEHLQYCG
jgi:hypothetical protein